MNKEYNENLLAIQWITKSEKFNERQLIQLGDAIAAFHDCICEKESLQAQAAIDKETIKAGHELAEFYGNKDIWDVNEMVTSQSSVIWDGDLYADDDIADSLADYYGGKRARAYLEKYSSKG